MAANNLIFFGLIATASLAAAVLPVPASAALIGTVPAVATTERAQSASSRDDAAPHVQIACRGYNHGHHWGWRHHHHHHHWG